MKKLAFKHLLHFNSFKDVHQLIIHHIKQTVISIMRKPYLFLLQTHIKCSLDHIFFFDRFVLGWHLPDLAASSTVLSLIGRTAFDIIHNRGSSSF